MSDRSDDVVGVAIPAAMAFLGLSFIACALLITGLPPLSGFVAKFSLLAAALTSSTDAPSTDAWLLVTAVLVSGLAGIIAFGRTGIRLFWSTEDATTPRLRLSEAAPVGVLILACVVLAWKAGPTMSYLEDAARYLDRPHTYIDAVLHQSSLRPVATGARP
jgi:multicomponent K+:H+ antiporter subunit D